MFARARKGGRGRIFCSGRPGSEGTTDLCAVFFSSRILDFHRATGPGDTHPLLFDWVRQYFSQAGGTSELPARLTSTSLPPLYLQHHGTAMTGRVPAYISC